MKNLLFILFFVLTQVSSAQEITEEMFITPTITGSNMSIIVDEDQTNIFDQFEGGQLGAFYDLNGDGNLVCVGLVDIVTGLFALTLWGDDLVTPEIDGLESGITPQFVILHNDNIIYFDMPNSFNGYSHNDLFLYNDSNIYIDGCHENYIDYTEVYSNISVDSLGCTFYNDLYLFVTPQITDANMTVGVNSSQLDQFEGGQIGAFYDLDGDGTIECVGLADIVIGFFGLALWGDNSSTPEKDGLAFYDIPQYVILYGGNSILIESNQNTGYVTNNIIQLSNFELTGCSNEMYIEYYENQDLWLGLDYSNSNCNTLHTTNGLQASMFVEPQNTGLNMSLPVLDGLSSFVGGQIAAFHDVDGDTICVGLEYITDGVVGFSVWGDDSTTPEIDGLLLDEIPFFAIYYNEVVFSVYLPEFNGYASNDIVSINEVILQTEYGCSDTEACNYLPYALNESCEYPLQFYNCDGNCINDEDGDLVCDELEVDGCMNENYVEFSSEATDDNGTCLTTWQQAYINAELNTVHVNLSEGWNIIAYANKNPINVVDGVSDIEDVLIIIKNNNAEFYLPEYGFNGIGNFEPGQGYQLKIIESYDSFSFQNPVVFGCMDENADNYNPNATHNDGSCYLIGCSDFSACNFYPYLTIVDDSICEYPEQGYDCNGEIINPE
jgi:hypothetical protein